MTLDELLDGVDTLRPNAWTRAQKCTWVSDLEAQLWTEVLLQSHGLWSARSPETDGARPLLLPDTWRRLYTAYLMAMIDLANGEYDAYAGSMGLYNGIAAELGAWYASGYDPAGTPARWARLGRLAYDGLDGARLALPDGGAILALRWQPLAEADGSGVAGVRSPSSGNVWQEVDIINGSTEPVLRLGMLLPPGEPAAFTLTYRGTALSEGSAELWALIQPEKK